MQDHKINQMTHYQPLESDWKIFKSLVHEWRERYFCNRNKEIVALLNRDENTFTENFWDAIERMQEIEGIVRACLDDHRRSSMLSSLILMRFHTMITNEDLDRFSEQLRARIATLEEM